MKSLTKVLMAGVLAVLVVGVGVAVAHGPYGSHAGAGNQQSQAGEHSQGTQQMQSSRLSQVAYLTGLAEIDDQGEDDAGDPDAKGSANFLQVNETTVCYGFMIRGAETPTEVHIHKGVAGENGPVVLAFDNVPKDKAGAPAGDPGASAGCKETETPEEAAALARIRKNPGNYYVNIHTTSFPDGAVRGQLGPVFYDNDGS